MFGQSYLMEQFQNRSGFKIEHEKTFPFSSQIGYSLPAFREMHLHLLYEKTIAYNY